ncbi:hypothetical protein B5G16_10565 [Alistipes sp. An66]|nr:hypothetical protein B5G16_10565 [Alistipes sp. An66]
MCGSFRYCVINGSTGEAGSFLLGHSQYRICIADLLGLDWFLAVFFLLTLRFTLFSAVFPFLAPFFASFFSLNFLIRLLALWHCG